MQLTSQISVNLGLYSSMQGYGTNFYGPAEYYEGEWYRNWRSGWGRMYYADGSVYEGEWYDDKRQGKGLLRLGERLVSQLYPYSHVTLRSMATR